MDNFDLKQFLVENKLTENSRLGEIKTVPGSTGTTRFVDLKVGLSLGEYTKKGLVSQALVKIFLN
jgi:hypothetical protein